MWKWLVIKWKKARKRHLPLVIIYLLYPLLRLILLTCRFKVEGLERYHQIALIEPTLLLLWHDRLAGIVPFLSKFSPHLHYIGFVSDSRDGHLIARLIRSFRNGKTIQVPHDARQKALRELVKSLKEKKGVVVMTPDGPRGPRHKAKQGAAVASLMSYAQIVTFNWKASKSWELSTWDKMAFPKPFSKICITFGDPFLADREKWTVESLTEEINRKLEEDVSLS